MAHDKRVTIELTDAQKTKLKKEAGVEIQSLSYDPLEDRFAPFTRLGKKFPMTDDPTA
jgi:hypothetical protein